MKLWSAPVVVEHQTERSRYTTREQVLASWKKLCATNVHSLHTLQTQTASGSDFGKVLERYGVIGGSSASATIHGDYLVRGAIAGSKIM